MRRDRQRLQAQNDGPQFPFTEATWLWIGGEDRAEVDSSWSRLTAEGGHESICT